MSSNDNDSAGPRKRNKLPWQTLVLCQEIEMGCYVDDSVGPRKINKLP